MPYKPKIVTRGISTSTVSTDSIPKNAALTNNELDSNFLNIRDASIGIASDDSTVIDIALGNTLKIAGGTGISTAVSGQTLTITGTSQAQGITFVGDDSTGTRISDGETVKFAGGGGTTVSVSGDIITINGGGNIGDLQVTAYGALAYSTFLSPSGSANRDIVLSGFGTGKVSLPNRVVFGDITESGSRLSVTGNGQVITAYGANEEAANDQLTLVSGTSQSSDRSRIKLSAKYLQLNHNINTFIQATGGNGDLYIQNGVSSSDPTTGAHNSIVLTDNNDGEIIITPKTNKWVEINDNKIVIKTSQDPAAIGSAGDRAGSIAWNNTNLYLCTANYDGSTIIWKKVVLVSI